MFVNKYFTFEPQQAILLWLSVLTHQATGKVKPKAIVLLVVIGTSFC